MSMTRTNFRSYEDFADRADAMKDRLKDKGKWPGVRPKPPEPENPDQPQQVPA